MTAATQTLPDEDLTAFMRRIEPLSTDELHDAFMNEVIEQGGFWTAPEGTASHLVEISLHTITGRGTTESEAIADWRAAAERTQRQET